MMDENYNVECCGKHSWYGKDHELVTALHPDAVVSIMFPPQFKKKKVIE